MFCLWRFTPKVEKFSVGLNPSRYELEDPQTFRAVATDFQPSGRRIRQRHVQTTPRKIGRQRAHDMRRLIALLLLLGAAHVGAEPLRITTWNLNSSVATETVSSAEDSRLAEIATVLSSLNPDVILLQEIRDRQACERLAVLLKPARYRVAVCSAFTNESGALLPQVAILSRKPIIAAWTDPWKGEGAVAPPGGFAFALIHHGSGDVGIFSVQFKDNATSSNFERDTQLNILSRENSAAQLVQQAASLGAQPIVQPSAIVVGGSFNTNPDEPQFVSEITLRLLENAGFKSLFQGVPLEDRITRRGDGRHPDATIDYVFARNSDFLAAPRIVASELSGHLPVSCEAIIKPAAPIAKVPTAFQPLAQWRAVGLALLVALFLFWWWWVVGRKRFYSPPLAGFVEESGSALQLDYPGGSAAFSALPGTLDGFEADGEWLPASAGPGASRLRMQSLEKRAAAAEQRARQATDLVREGLLPHLARLMKDRLFRGLASQRAHLLLTQEAGAVQVAELEQRLANIHAQMQNKFGAYERRIAELEQEVRAKEQINRELLETKAQQTKQAIAAARTREQEPQRI
jgi:endonuclease/exonuclease/phosphatase family metal-dependent hydrolase